MPGGKKVVETVKIKENGNQQQPKPQRTRKRSRSRGRSRSRTRGTNSAPHKVAPEGTLQTSIGSNTSPTKVVVETKGDNAGRARSNSRGRNNGGRGRFGGARRGMPAHLQREINVLKRKVDGIKVAKTMTGTFTIGNVHGSKDTGLERKFHVFLNPLLNKNTSSGQSLTPLVDTAKDYAVWRIAKFHVRFMPLVNSSNVAGTITLASLDQNAQEAKDTSIDDITARPYCEVQTGARVEWKINPRKLEGPRQGWWVVDPNVDPAEYVGPAVDVHTYGETFDLLNVTEGKANNYLGPLFLLQVTYTYQFGNWEPKPGLGTMVSEKVGVQDVTVSESPVDGELRLQVNETPASRGKLHRLTERADSLHLRRPTLHMTQLAEGESLGNTIWQLASGAAEKAAEVVPGPWGWLLKNGLYFLRRVFNQSSNALIEFKLYPSIEDASKNLGCQDSGISTPVKIEVNDEDTNLTQLSCINVQSNPVTGFRSSGGGPSPPAGEFPYGKQTEMRDLLVDDSGQPIPDVISRGNLPSYGAWICAFNQSLIAQGLVVLSDPRLEVRCVEGATWPNGDRVCNMYFRRPQADRTQMTQYWVDTGPVYNSAQGGTAVFFGNFNEGRKNNTYGVLGDNWSLYNTLKLKNDAGAKVWGGFRKIDNVEAEANPIGIPNWLTTGDRWVAPVAYCFNNYEFRSGYLGDNTPMYGGGILGVSFARPGVYFYGLLPNFVATDVFGPDVVPNPGITPSTVNKFMLMYTGGFGSQIPSRKSVTFRMYDNVDGQSCSCTGACSCPVVSDDDEDETASSFDVLEKSDAENYASADEMEQPRPLTREELEAQLRSTRDLLTKLGL
ncbi:capsid protein [Astroviridae sp.]|nr:capsid protein [Astroviridae sp.]